MLFSEGIPDDWSVWEVLEAVELVAATEGFFKLAVEPLDEPPIRNDEPKNKHKMFFYKLCKRGPCFILFLEKFTVYKLIDLRLENLFMKVYL